MLIDVDSDFGWEIESESAWSSREAQVVLHLPIYGLWDA